MITQTMERALSAYDRGHKRQAVTFAGGRANLDRWLSIRRDGRNCEPKPPCPPERTAGKIAERKPPLESAPDAIYTTDHICYHLRSNPKRGREHKTFLIFVFRAAAVGVCDAFKTTDADIIAADLGLDNIARQARNAWIAIVHDLAAGVVADRELATALFLPSSGLITDMRVAHIRAAETDLSYREAVASASQLAKVAMTDLVAAAGSKGSGG